MQPTKKDDDLIAIEESEYSFEYWINKPFISSELKQELRKANLLIVPHESFRNIEEPLFASGSHELLQFINEHRNEAIHPDICIEDDDYKELSLHSIEIVLGQFVVASVITGVFIELISEYLKRAIFSKDTDEAQVSFEMHVIEPGKTTKRIRYKGPDKAFKEVVSKSLNLPINTKPDSKNINGPKKS